MNGSIYFSDADILGCEGPKIYRAIQGIGDGVIHLSPPVDFLTLPVESNIY